MNNKEHNYAILLWPARTLLLALLTANSALAGGTQASSARALNTAPTPLEQSLGLLKQEDKAGAVQKFLEINCKTGPLFSPNSPMTAAEKDLPRMSDSEREHLISMVMVGLKDLKQLAGVVKEKAVTEAATKPQLARQYLSKLNDLGTALDSPDALKIVQLTGQSLCKTSAAEAAKLTK
jgi:hypothetical protein